MSRDLETGQCEHGEPYTFFWDADDEPVIVESSCAECYPEE